MKTQFINLEKKYWQNKATSDQTIIALGERISGLQKQIEEQASEIQNLKTENGFSSQDQQMRAVRQKNELELKYGKQLEERTQQMLLLKEHTN